MMKPQLVGAAVALAVCPTLSLAPPAVADAHVPCAVLDQLRNSLDNDVSVGMGGVRTVITSPYLTGGPQKRDADANLALVSHGVHVLEDINGLPHVPVGLVQLDEQRGESGDMRQAVDALFQPTWGGLDYGSTLSLAWPQPATWTVIDYADQKRNDIYSLVNGLQGGCTA